MTESLEGPANADQLIVKRDGVVIQTLALTMDTLTIGRFPDNGLVLPDQRVSRDHVLLRREADTFVVVDKSSTGTWVNGKRVSKDDPYHLAPSDEIQIGPFTLTYKAQPTVVRVVRSDIPTVPQIQVLDRRRQVVQVAELWTKEASVTRYAGTAGRQTAEVAETRTKGSCRIGRSKSNDLVLDSRYVSREQLRADWDGRTVTVTDLGSSNGTWKDGNQLPKGQPIQWDWGETLRAGPYYLRLDRVRRTDRIDVSLDKPALTLKPTQPDVIKVTLTNLGDTVDHLTVLVAGPGVQRGWWAGPEVEVQLNPRVRTTVPITVSVPNRPDSRAGDYPIQVRARSRENPAESGFADGSWTVMPYTEDALQLSPGRVAGRLKGSYDVVLHNGGNTPVTYTLGASDEEKALKYAFKAGTAEANTVEIGPGETKRLGLQVRPPLRLTGPAQQRSFLVKALPKGVEQPRQAAVVFSQLAVIPAWVMWMMTRAVPAVAALAFALLFIFPQNPKLVMMDGNGTVLPTDGASIADGERVVLCAQQIPRLMNSAKISWTATAGGKDIPRYADISQHPALGSLNPDSNAEVCKTFNPGESLSYTLTTANFLGVTRSDTKAVAVIPQPGAPKLSIQEPDQISSEKDAVKLALTSQDATRVTVSQKWDGKEVWSKSLEGEARADSSTPPLQLPASPPAEGYVYEVSAINEAATPPKTNKKQVRVFIKTPAQPQQFTTAETTVYEGAEVVLHFAPPVGATGLVLSAEDGGPIDTGNAQTADVMSWSQYSVYPARTTTYLLTAKNAAGSSPQAKLKVNVKPMEITYFRAEPNTVTQGGTTQLKWDVKGAPGAGITIDVEPTEGDLESEVGPVPLTGQAAVAPKKKTTYKLLVSYANGAVATSANKKTLEETATVEVNVPPRPVVANLSGPQEVVEGTAVPLSISAQGATHITLLQLSAGDPNRAPIIKDRAVSDPYTTVQTVTLSETTIFRLTAENKDNKAKSTFEWVVAVTEASPTPQSAAPGGLNAQAPDGNPTYKGSVPFVSQNLTDKSALADSNCGPASLSMVLGYLGKPATTTQLRTEVDAHDKQYSDPDRGSSWAALKQAAWNRNLYAETTTKLKVDDLCSAKNTPLIILVNYYLLPQHLNRSKVAGHYIVVLGCDAQGKVVYHDPWKSGAFKKATKEQLYQAWAQYRQPSSAMLVRQR